MNKPLPVPFVPESFIIPDALQNEQFLFDILEPSVAELDYQAVMSSRNVEP